MVLDESQKIQNSTTVISKSACALLRTHSWLMSGTPVGNVVEDLLGQLRFLQVQPWGRLGTEGGHVLNQFWEEQVTTRWKEEGEDALEIVHFLLQRIMMRHSKSQTLQVCALAIFTALFHSKYKYGSNATHRAHRCSSCHHEQSRR